MNPSLMRASGNAARPRNSLLYGLLLTLGCGLLVFLLIHHYVSVEDNDYYWDYRLYWHKYAAYGELLKTDPQRWLRRIVLDAWGSEYNEVFTVPLSPFSYFFGDRRLWYIEGIGLVFLLPALLVCHAGIRALLRERLGQAPDHLAGVALLAWVVLFPPFWAPSLRGFPDIAGLIFLAAACRIIMSGVIMEKQRLRDILLLAVFLYLPFLLRKWYGYAIVATYCCGLVYSFYLTTLRKPVQTPMALVDTAFRFLVVAGLLCLQVYFFQGAMAYTALHAGYGSLFSAYQVPFEEHASGFFGYFGWPVLLLAVAGLVAAWRQPGRLGPIVLFHLAALLITEVLFTRMQQLYLQHYIPVAYFLLVLSCIGMGWLLASLSGAAGRQLLAGLVVFTAFFSFADDFGFVGGPLRTATAWLAPAHDFPPLRFPAGNEYDRLITDLRRLLPPRKTCAVFASSPLMNDTLLQTLAGPALYDNIRTTPQIDLRDFWPVYSLRTNYVIVADPVQTHLPPETQQVITIPATLILDGQGIGAAYRKIASYAIGNGARAYLYEKTRPFTRAEVEALLDRFYVDHPDWRKALGTPDQMALYTAPGYVIAEPIDF